MVFTKRRSHVVAYTNTYQLLQSPDRYAAHALGLPPGYSKKGPSGHHDCTLPMHSGDLQSHAFKLAKFALFIALLSFFT